MITKDNSGIAFIGCELFEHFAKNYSTQEGQFYVEGTDALNGDLVLLAMLSSLVAMMRVDGVTSDEVNDMFAGYVKVSNMIFDGTITEDDKCSDQTHH